MARAIMIQGTMSNAGKSLIVTGLCRIFKQDGFKVAPFKSQNMALNSYITKDGLEMGRAQVVQAEACGIEPLVCMNPILLKPTTDMGSQVIIRGEVVGDMRAMDYYRHKREYIPVIRESYLELADSCDIVVIEGAGSPAEINLKQDDIVNMGMAEIADAPVLLVGDIDRGGVFAQLLGTIMLLEPEEKDRIKGLIINKFRGDKAILEPGLSMLEERCLKPVLGVVPYMDVDIEDEDSLAGCLSEKKAGNMIDIAVIRFPKISNFTDFQALALEEQVSVRYVERVEELGNPDMVILPGTKSTIADLQWMRTTGLEACIIRLKEQGTFVCGICGGYQMLGTKLIDEYGVEGKNYSIRGMGLLPVETRFEQEKTRTRVDGQIGELPGVFASLSGKHVKGYEIHMGQSVYSNGLESGTGQGKETRFGNAFLRNEQDTDVQYAGKGWCAQNVFGTYLHGIFDEEDFRQCLIKLMCKRKGIAYNENDKISYAEYKEKQYDRLADIVRASLDMKEIYRILGM